MSNRSLKILWPIDYSSMTSITHWCNWLPIDIIDYSSMIHRLLVDYYTAHERHISCFLVPFFSFVIYNWLSCWRNHAFTKGQITFRHIKTWNASHKYRWFLIVQYFTLPNSLFNNQTTYRNQPVWKWLLSSRKRMPSEDEVAVIISATICYRWLMNEIND